MVGRVDKGRRGTAHTKAMEGDVPKVTRPGLEKECSLILGWWNNMDHAEGHVLKLKAEGFNYLWEAHSFGGCMASCFST